MKIILLALLIDFFYPMASAQVSQNFLSESQPVYELGFGAVGLNLPDYPGSNNNRFRVVPFPYFIYRGKFVRADDEGTRARLLSSKRHELGFSVAFNFAVKSSDNQARLGMPDLDNLMSIGPRLLIRLIADDPNQRLNFSLATRAVYSSNFRSRFRAEGISIEPTLGYWRRFSSTGTTLFSNLSFEFGSVKLSRFFYEVTPQYATSTRTPYSAQAGLIESSLSIGLGQNFYRDDLFFFVAGSWRNLDSAKNRQSPLVETRNNIGLVCGVIWTFWESEEQVERITELGL